MGNVVALAQYREPDVTEPGIDWDSEHARLIQMFEEAEDSNRDNTQKAERDVDYYDGKQWTEDQISKLRKRGQAALMDNHIKPKIRFLQGLEQTKRTDPKASPRTPQAEQDANSCTDALRFVCDQNRLNTIRSKVFKDILSAGWGGYEVTVENRLGRLNPTIVVKRCAWDRMGADPYSSDDDYSDAAYRFMVRWMDRDQALAEYGEGADKVFDETVSFGQIGGIYDDKPKLTTWVSYNKRWRVRVVQMYFKHMQTGKICFAEYAPLSALATQYGTGTKTYLDALGLNGTDAAKAAQSQFTTNPGNDAAITAGLDAINRRRASAGMLDSGNADQDAQTFGQNLQNQQYNSWLDRLSGINANNLSATGAAASGQAGTYGSLADLSNQYGQNEVSLLGNSTSGQAGANVLQAQGEASGAKNLLGAGLSLASIAAGGFGGGLGSALGGTAGSAISGAFGPTSYGGASGPTPLTGGSLLGRWLS